MVEEEGLSRVARSLLFDFLLVILVVGCRSIRHQEANLSPPESRPIYRVEVSDSDEAALLRQELQVKPLRQEGPAFFFVATNTTLSRLRELGYSPQLADPGNIFYRVVEIPRRGSEESLRKSGVAILLREEGRWIVRGTLTQLKLLKSQRYRVLTP